MEIDFVFNAANRPEVIFNYAQAFCISLWEKGFPTHPGNIRQERINREVNSAFAIAQANLIDHHFRA